MGVGHQIITRVNSSELEILASEIARRRKAGDGLGTMHYIVNVDNCMIVDKFDTPVEGHLVHVCINWQAVPALIPKSSSPLHFSSPSPNYR